MIAHQYVVFHSLWGKHFVTYNTIHIYTILYNIIFINVET